MVEFSVVIATKNRATLLPRAIQSVLRQTMGDLEVIVADDGSTDQTHTVVAGLSDPRVHYAHQENAGPSAARNLGVARARGRFVAFLDDDDEALPLWLETLRQPLLEPNCAGVSGGAQRELADGSISVELPRAMGPAYHDLVGLFLCGTFALRRDVFLEIGGYTESLRWSEQTDLALRLCEAAANRGWTIASVPVPLITYHRAASGDRSSEVPEEMAKAAHHLLIAHAAALAREPRLRADYLAVAGVAEARSGHLGDARRDFWCAWRATPRNVKHLARAIATVSRSASARLWP